MTRLGGALAVGLWLALAAPAAAQNGVIDVTTLDALDPWAVGGVRPGERALPTRLWASTNPQALMAALEQVGQSPAHPAATSLLRRALLSSGAAPPEVTIDAARRRFAALTRLGAADSLPTMIQSSAQAAGDPIIAQYAAQAELGRNRPQEACALAARIEEETPSRFVARMRAFCFAVRGDKAAAALAHLVAAESGAGDPWLEAATAAIGAKSGPAANYETSLNAAASLAAGLKPGVQPLAKASTMAVRALAVDERTPAALRAQAAFQALRTGALTPAEARRALIAAAPPPPKPAPRGRAPAATFEPAAHLRDVRAAATPAAEAAALAQALSRAPTYADFAAMAQLLDDRIAALPRSLATAPHAPILARAALALDKPQLAFAWRGAIGLGGAAPSSLTNQTVLDMAIAAHGSRDAAAFAMEARMSALPALGSPNRAAALASAAREIAILRALGPLPPPEVLAMLKGVQPAGGTAMPSARLLALRSAASRGAIGETALQAGLALAGGAHRLDAASVAAVIESLYAVGLDADARAVAVEALIGTPTP